MRFLGVIFCIYLLAISVHPCGDRYFAFKGSEKDHMATMHTLDNGTEEEDPCPPFCICNCCAITIDYKVAVAQMRLADIFIPSEKDYPLSTTHYSSAFLGNIWQPPKHA